MDIRKIITEEVNDFDWVKGVSEYDNFFNWFRSRTGPGKWVGRDLQWWITHTQDVEYCMSALGGDIEEMLSYYNKIEDGTANASITLENLKNIGEFVIPHLGRNAIETQIYDIQNFIKEFRQYFGEDMSLSDMVESVGSALMYAEENNIPIHREIKESIKEDFDWVVNDTVPFLEIGEPLKIQAPKNQYRLHVTHGVGEDNGTWIPNWVNYDPTRNLDILMRHIKILNWLQENYREGIWGLAELWTEGETWVLSDQDNQNMKEEIGEFDKETGVWIKDGEETDADGARDIVWEWLNDELTDYGIREHDSYHQEDATIEDWKVTYFDEFGVEHAVKVNLPRS
jgi:hypothetical protein